MNGVRKTIALLIIIFICVPVLIGIIWGVGLTRAVVSPEFLTEIPQEIIVKVPSLLDETLETIDREDVIKDEDARQWVHALTQIETSPRELIEKIGIMSWLRNELSHSLDEIGKIFRGEIKPGPVILNMRPLKAALTHEGIEQYLMEIMNKLPQCSDDQLAIWIAEAAHEKPFEYDTPPACRPLETASAIKILRQAWINEVDEIPDEVDMIEFKHWDSPHRKVKITQIVVSVTYFLFFIPALLLLLAAVIATSSGSKMLRWVGIPALIGGIIAFLLSKFIGQAAQWGIDFGPASFSYGEMGHAPFSEVGEIFIEKMGGIILVVLDHLFSAINTVAGTVCIVGIVLIAISYLIGREDRDSDISSSFSTKTSSHDNHNSNSSSEPPTPQTPSPTPSESSAIRTDTPSIASSPQLPSLPEKGN